MKFQAPPIRTPLLGNPPKSDLKSAGQFTESANKPSYPWMRYFQSVTDFLSGPQIPFFTPASATANGTAGSITHDANFLYVCVAKNTWKRIGLSSW